MATTQVVKVKVDELSKYGFKANGKFVGLSKQLPDADKSRIVPGAEFEAEYYIADSGKEYLNKIIRMLVPAVAAVASPLPPPYGAQPDTTRAKKFTPKFEKKDDEKMTKADWDAKDQRISRQGVIQAAVIALAPVVSLELLPAEAKKLATEMLVFVKGE